MIKSSRKLRAFHCRRSLRSDRRMRSRFISSSSAWHPFQATHGAKIFELPEQKATRELIKFLKQNGTSHKSLPRTPIGKCENTLSRDQHRICIDAAIATFCLHVHARIASLVGQGFYTIGPCGEELLSSAALALHTEDSSALHYRHTGISLARQMAESPEKLLEDLLLARARGYTVSKLDPVTGGVHCSIGGGPNEYLVTSTLASQCPSAVGRALGYSLLSSSTRTQTKDKPISFVTIGDGSVHNHHFLSSLTLARHAKHLKIKCPIVFGISNNGLSISYSTNNYVDTLFDPNRPDPLMPIFRANGQDLFSVYDQTKKACDYARQFQSPCVLVYSNVVRRFGHAATDRQAAYLSDDTIQAMSETCNLEMTMRQAVEDLGYYSYSELANRFEEIYQLTDRAFATAITEPKVNLTEMMERVEAPPAILPSSDMKEVPRNTAEKGDKGKEGRHVMRKHMNQVLHEVMAKDSSIVYLGEDVRHGGYYRVTEGLADEFPSRVLDFPPDETTLLGAALGFAQLGMTPIVEIPYAKYLDCGVDMFYEIAMQHWLAAPDKSSSRSRKGMVIRLQGFDRGVFGGNFHTHNMLNHMPPGVDVVCFSNGPDYVKGMRYAVLQANAGRIVMFVDCTHLLNLRHLHDRDRGLEFSYPNEKELLGFDDIRIHRDDELDIKHGNMTIVSFGNGVVTSLQARESLKQSGILGQDLRIDVIDCPYLSGVPRGLENTLNGYEGVVFADICKEGPGSNIFSSMITSLNQRQALPLHWEFVGAPRTYNPLGSTATFLSQHSIEDAVTRTVHRRLLCKSIE